MASSKQVFLFKTPNNRSCLEVITAKQAPPILASLNRTIASPSSLVGSSCLVLNLMALALALRSNEQYRINFGLTIPFFAVRTPFCCSLSAPWLPHSIRHTNGIN